MKGAPRQHLSWSHLMSINCMSYHDIRVVANLPVPNDGASLGNDTREDLDCPCTYVQPLEGRNRVSKTAKEHTPPR